ncbi:MAG: M42 family peptidase, partial [Chloroflexus sp.]
MQEHQISFLKRLLAAPGPSGEEDRAARVWRTEARTFADTVYSDVLGNSFAVLEGSDPRILLA